MRELSRPSVKESRQIRLNSSLPTSTRLDLLIHSVEEEVKPGSCMGATTVVFWNSGSYNQLVKIISSAAGYHKRLWNTSNFLSFKFPAPGWTHKSPTQSGLNSVLTMFWACGWIGDIPQIPSKSCSITEETNPFISQKRNTTFEIFWGTTSHEKFDAII